MVTSSARIGFVTNRAVKTRGRSSFFTDKPGAFSEGHCYLTRDSDRYQLDGIVAGQLSETDMSPHYRPRILYTHGYAEGLKRACRRAARLRQLLPDTAALLLASWPANSNPLTYHSDRKDLERSAAFFDLAIRKVLEATEAKDVVLVSHSLGSLALIKAVSRLDSTSLGDRKLRQLVLIAPDIAVTTFMQYLPVLQDRIEEIVVYTSRKDRALQASARYHGSQRLGRIIDASIPDGLTIVEAGDTTINDWTGHNYHVKSDAVGEDLSATLGKKVQSRQFERVRIEGHVWRLVRRAN